MTFSGNPKQLRCLVSATLAIALLVLLGLAVILPWWNQMALYDEEALGTAERMGRYQNLIASKQDLAKELQQLRADQNKQGVFITAPSTELAAAQLQKQAKDAVSQAGGTLVSTQNLEPDTDDMLEKIRVRVRMKGDAGALADVLHSIESAHPLMFVENLKVKSRRTVKGRRKNRVTTYNLDVNFDLAGYLLGGKG
jgi:general secretion pathway protein M